MLSMATSEASAPGGGERQIIKAWQKVEKRVVQMAGGDPSLIKRSLGIEGVLAVLDQAQSDSKKAAAKNAAVKNVFDKTLQCIQVVGGIVVSGVSTVFAPACTCYNALTFVIQAWQGYDGIFDCLASLLEKCTEFLDRLTYYAQGKMDPKLTRVACLHLELFVEICDRSLKLKEKRHKFAAFMKQLFFLEDDGIKNLLSSMQALVDKEHGLVLAQTWKSSNDAAAFSRDGLALTRKVHDSLVEEKSQNKREKDTDLWKRSIVHTLECDQEILDSNNADPWEKAWKRHRVEVLEGTGDWLLQDPRFIAWVEGNGPGQIFGLSGDQGTGKTLLASTIILHLRKGRAKSADGGSSRAIVAYNFVDADPRLNGVDGVSFARIMSKNVLCQLALGDEPLLKSMAAICEQCGVFKNTLEMWEMLLHGNRDLSAMNVTLFFVLDGIRGNVHAVNEILQSLSTSSIANRVRVLITGDEAVFEEIRRGTSSEVVTITVPHFNHLDINLFIENRLDNMEILKEKERTGVSDIRKKILQDLPSLTKGDYYKISRVLDQISRTDDSEEISSLLESAGSTRPDQIEADIRQLNEVRTDKEILEINELILWINNMIEALPLVEDIDGIFELAFGNSTSSSLMSMDSKIKSKYKIFSTGFEGLIDYQIAEIRDKIPLKSQAAWTTTDELKEISQNEVAMIKHYLSTLCPRPIYDKFGFDEFFDRKLVRRGVYIHQDPDNAHVLLVLRCIRCLVQERNEKTKLLYGYCREQLLQHLKKADLALADRAIKAEAGQMLVRLFTENHAVSSLFCFDCDDNTLDDDIWGFARHSIPFNWKDWLNSDDAIACLSKWLQDSAVIQRVKDHPLVASFNEPGADRQSVLFDKAMKEAAANIFRKGTEKEGVLRSFAFLYMAIAKKELPGNDWMFIPTLPMAHMIEDWSREALGCPQTDAIWETRAADLLYFLERHFADESRKRAKKAMELDPEHWKASVALARATIDCDESIKILRPIVDERMNDKEWLKDDENKAILTRMMYALSEKYRWSFENDHDAAKELQLKLLDIDRSPKALIRYSRLIDDYATSSRWDDMVTFLDKALDDSEDGMNTMEGFLDPAIYYSFIRSVSRAIRATKRFDLLESIFAKSYKSDLPPEKLRRLKMIQARMLMKIDGYEERAAALMDQAGQIFDGSYEGCGLIGLWAKLARRDGVSRAEAASYHAKIMTAYSDNESYIHSFTKTCVEIAQYFQHLGDEKAVKHIVKCKVSEALEMLADDDLENDTTSLFLLNVMFSLMRDMDNLAVTWELMCVAVRAQKYENKRLMDAWERKQAAQSRKSEEPGSDVASDDVASDVQGAGNKDKESGTVEEEEVSKAMENSETGVNEAHEEADAVADPEDASSSTSSSSSSPRSFIPYTESDVDEDPWWNTGREIADEEIEREPSGRFAWCVACAECRTCQTKMYGLWHCMTAAGQYHLDPGCYQKMLDGKPLGSRCTLQEEWIQIPPREKSEAVPRGSVRVGERIITYEEWKTEIRKKYVD